jgi:hypothetical protein
MKYVYHLLIIACFISCKKEKMEAVSLPQIKNALVQENPKNLYPEIGYTPDISFSAKQNFINNQKLYHEISKLIDSIGDFDEAKKHLTEKQIEIYENEEEFMAEDHLSVGGVGCSWYCGGGPMSIKATSELNPNKGFTYNADNIHDFSLRNAWIEGKKNSGINESVTFEFIENGPPVTTVEIFNGYMKTEKTWEENGRVKKLKLYANDKAIAILNLKNIKSLQRFNIGTHQSQKGNLYLKFEIIATYKGSKYDDTAISELNFDGTGVHCFVAGTKIKMANSEEKNIEDLNENDEVLSFNEKTKTFRNTKIKKLAKQIHSNLYEIQFEKRKVIVTDDHPFYFEGNYYSVIENSKYVSTSKLEIGNYLNTFDKNKIGKEKVISIKKLDRKEMTYTIVELEENELFLANNLLVKTEKLAESETPL